MYKYLEEAAQLLRAASRANLYHEQRIEIAREFATLAAIDKGLLPSSIIEDIVRAIANRAGA